MEKSCTETVDIAAEIFRPVAQSLRRDVVWRPPNLSSGFGPFPCHACQTEVADLGGVFVSKQDVGRLYIAMDKTLLVGRTQPSCDLNPALKDLLLWQLFPFFNEIIEAPMIDQLHHHIKLPVISSG